MCTDEGLDGVRDGLVANVLLCEHIVGQRGQVKGLLSVAGLRRPTKGDRLHSILALVALIGVYVAPASGILKPIIFFFYF